MPDVKWMILTYEQDSFSLEVQMVLAKLNLYLNLPVYSLTCM